MSINRGHLSSGSAGADASPGCKKGCIQHGLAIIASLTIPYCVDIIKRVITVKTISGAVARGFFAEWLECSTRELFRHVSSHDRIEENLNNVREAPGMRVRCA